MAELKSLFRNNGITRKNEIHNISIVVEGVFTYGAEVRELNKKKDRLPAKLIRFGPVILI